MEHPKVLLWSVVILALIVAVVYYFSMSDYGWNRASQTDTPATRTLQQQEAFVNSLKSTTTSWAQTPTPKEEKFVNSLKGTGATNPKPTNDSFVNSLKGY